MSTQSTIRSTASVWTVADRVAHVIIAAGLGFAGLYAACFVCDGMLPLSV